MSTQRSARRYAAAARDLAEGRVFPTVVGTNPNGSDLTLSFDDGPTPGLTEILAPALANAGHHATFFVLLPRAIQNPEIVRLLVAHGHEVAVHGFEHSRTVGMPHAELTRRLRGARGELEELAGARVTYFRPPFGAQSRRTYLAARRAAVTPTGWSLNSADYSATSAAAVVDGLRAAIAPGALVLLHDGDGDRPPGPLAEASISAKLEIFEALASLLAELGLRSRTLGALVRRNGAVARRWVRGCR